MAEMYCVHCGERIVRADFLGREAYTHQPVGASFGDGQHLYCYLTTATPRQGSSGVTDGEAT
jgi:hypothetical protein